MANWGPIWTFSLWRALTFVATGEDINGCVVILREQLILRCHISYKLMCGNSSLLSNGNTIHHIYTHKKKKRM